jgi:RNA polymerase-binding transcription factor DksA
VLEELTAEFEQHANAYSALTVEPRTRLADRDRANAALRMLSTREAIQRVEDALVRIDDGSYAICQSGGRSIQYEQQEATPQERLCAACDPTRSR